MQFRHIGVHIAGTSTGTGKYAGTALRSSYMAYNLISSNATIKAVKPGDARGRLTDCAGLYVRLFVKGGSHGWRFDYSLNGKRNTLSLGTYPNTGLSLARKKADEARKLVSAGIDPSTVRKEACHHDFLTAMSRS